MYRITYHKTDWDRTLEKAAYDFANNPTAENKQEILYLLDIEEETLWREVRKNIQKDYEKDKEYERSGKYDQAILKEAVEQLEYINRNLTGEAKQVMGNYWQGEINKVRAKLFKRVTG